MSAATQIELDYNAPAARQTRLDRRFAEFVARHPEVYATLVELAREAKAAGWTQCGVKMLWEVMRWKLRMRTGELPYALDNSLTSRFARLVMQREPDLAGFFETRGLRS